MGLDGEPKAELGARKDGVQFVKFLAEVGQSPRPTGRRLCRDGDTQLLLADLQPRREEAVFCVEELRPPVKVTAGAMEWLEAQGRAAKTQGRRPKQRKRRKRKSR